jgi:hypothetical protein
VGIGHFCICELKVQPRLFCGLEVPPGPFLCGLQAQPSRFPLRAASTARTRDRVFGFQRASETSPAGSYGDSGPFSHQVIAVSRTIIVEISTDSNRLWESPTRRTDVWGIRVAVEFVVPD